MAGITQQEVRGGDVTATDLWREACAIAAEARRQLIRHRERMLNDPEYRAVVEYVTRSLSGRPDLLGRAARAVTAGHALLVEAER